MNVWAEKTSPVLLNEFQNHLFLLVLDRFVVPLKYKYCGQRSSCFLSVCYYF